MQNSSLFKSEKQTPNSQPDIVLDSELIADKTRDDSNFKSALSKNNEREIVISPSDCKFSAVKNEKLVSCF